MSARFFLMSLMVLVVAVGCATQAPVTRAPEALYLAVEVREHGQMVARPKVLGFEGKMRQTVFVSATPGNYEQQHAGAVVEQLVRPTGLDPMVEVRPATSQVDDVLQEIRIRVNLGERVLKIGRAHV